MLKKYDIPSPAVTVDLDTADRNLKRVAAAVKKANLNFRPHQKTHKTIYFTKKAIEAGASGICAAKLSEAEIFADYGIDNILIAFPLYGEEKWIRLSLLNRRANIATTVDSFEIAKGISDFNLKINPEKPVDILIEVDLGTLRCGVSFDLFEGLAKKIVSELKGVRIVGAFTYNGLNYSCKNMEELKAAARRESEILTSCRNILEKLKVEVKILSGGNSPDMLALDMLTGLTEVRPGNLIFNDVSSINMGIARDEDCAIKILATIVSVPMPGHATCDAGSKTLTYDGAFNWKYFGKVLGMDDVKIVKLNEEHGYITYDPGVRTLKVGDRIEIIPNHVCVIPNLCDKLYGVRGDFVDEIIPVVARGKNY